MKIKFKKLTTHAVTPKKAHETDAAFDLVAVDKAYDPESQYIEIGTGIAIELPKGYIGLLFPRSSISKTPLSLCNSVGVIDENYRGEICLRFNKIKENLDHYEYDVGDRVGQLMVIKREDVQFEEVEELEDTDRGSGGFGSTGK